MFKKIVFLILVLVIHAPALNLQLSVRGSGFIFWNEGWRDKFFFHTFTQEEWEDIQNGKKFDFNRTLRHETILNPEIWFSIPLSDDFVLSFTMKYQHLEIDLHDSIHFSWIRWLKGLNADLNFFSTGVRINWIGPVHPYIGGNIGYCHGNLITSHILDPPDSTYYSVQVDGDGGGMFYDILGGINIHLANNFGLFVEASYRLSPKWNEFKLENIHGDINDNIEWIYDNDRHLDQMFGWNVSFGVLFEIK